MKLLNFAFRRETEMPMLALIFASGVSVVLVVGRMIWTGNIKYGFLLWNLFLAWLPLIFALLACNERGYETGRARRFAGFAVVWLLFFPNAPYIFTDVIHLTGYFYHHFWVDLVLILSCALTGMVLGFVSLFLMQAEVARILGRSASWVFVAFVAGLSGLGIYLGRFLRFNSWDVLVNPLGLFRGIGNWILHPATPATSYAFPALFATFMFVSYLMLYALTHLRTVPVEAVTRHHFK